MDSDVITEDLQFIVPNGDVNKSSGQWEISCPFGKCSMEATDARYLDTAITVRVRKTNDTEPLLNFKDLIFHCMYAAETGVQIELQLVELPST